MPHKPMPVLGALNYTGQGQYLEFHNATTLPMPRIVPEASQFHLQCNLHHIGQCQYLELHNTHASQYLKRHDATYTAHVKINAWNFTMLR